MDQTMIELFCCIGALVFLTFAALGSIAWVLSGLGGSVGVVRVIARIVVTGLLITTIMTLGVWMAQMFVPPTC
jgi:hypothetical protein